MTCTPACSDLFGAYNAVRTYDARQPLGLSDRPDLRTLLQPSEAGATPLWAPYLNGAFATPICRPDRHAPALAIPIPSRHTPLLLYGSTGHKAAGYSHAHELRPLPRGPSICVTVPPVTLSRKVGPGLQDLQIRARRILAEKNAEKAEENTWIGRMVAAESIGELDGLIKSRAA